MPRPEEDSLHTNYRPYLHLECRLVAPPTQSVRRAAAALAFLSSNFFHRNLPNPNLLASKRCFSGGTDTSGGLETLRQSPGVARWGPTEETWNRFRNPETYRHSCPDGVRFQRIKH